MENINMYAPAHAHKKSERTPKIKQSGHIEIKDRFFLQALKSVGYDVYTAIAELIDNSIDAGATHVTIDYDSKNAVFVIQDNGRGMSAHQLDIAMDLGSDQEYTEEQISYFGSGMKTAIINIVSQLQGKAVIETNDGNETSKLTWYPIRSFRDYDGPISVKNPSFEKGTKITIDNIEKFQVATLKRLLGMMFYPTLKTETLLLQVNGANIIGNDPLYRNSEKTLTNYVTAKVKGRDIRIDAVMLHPEQEKHTWDAADGSDKRFSYHKGGAYIKYGGRYIEYGGFLGTRINHPSLNMVRFEFSIPKELTEIFGVKFNKTNGLDLDPKKDKNEVLSDLIQKVRDVVNWSATQREQMKVDNATEEDKTELGELTKKLNDAARKARFKKPSTQKKNKTSENDKEPVKKDSSTKSTERDVTSVQTKIHKFDLYDLRFQNLGNNAVFWHLGYENDKFIITLNDNHVFYTEYWINMNETAKTALSFLLGAVAQAQYDTMKNNFTITEVRSDFFWEDFWAQVSVKLRHLTLS